MIVSCIEGGLGNQLFQYFQGYAAAKRTGFKWGIDTSTFLHQGGQFRLFGPGQAREFSLGDLGLPIHIVRSRGLPPRSRFSFLLPYLPFWGAPWRVMKESEFTFCEQFLKPSDNSLLVGYFQSERYFVEFADEIRALLSRSESFFLTEQQLLPISSIENSVALHVRIGDYLTDSKASRVHGVLSPDYYLSAVEQMRSRFGKLKFFVFSDTPNRAVETLRNVLDQHEFEVVSGRGYSDFQEFFLMRRCRHHVLANSSFSWWGAWSSESLVADGSIKIAPTRWFGVGMPLDTKDLVPGNWLRC